MKNKHVFVAIDSFKGCLSTFEAAQAAKNGLVEIGFDPEEVHCFPMADGGEGTCTVVASYKPGRMVSAEITAPTGDKTTAEYLLCEDGTAYMETATTCGYTQVPDSMRIASKLTSYGLGELMIHAAQNGARKIVIGLGGTSTTDGGLGALQALGVKFYGGSCCGLEALPDTAPSLGKPLYKIDARSLASWDIPVELWADTEATFCGEIGAVKMYGKQKGIKPEEMPQAEAWMEHLGELMEKAGGRAPHKVAGTGAAGGIGGGLYAMLGATIASGAEQMLKLCRFSEQMKETGNVAYVISGEGKFDRQTVTGKLPAWVARAGRENGTTNVCVCGCAEIKETGLFDHILVITPEGMPLSEALKTDVAAKNMAEAIKGARHIF